MSSWAQTLREELGEELEPVLAAYECVKALWQAWQRGIAWHEKFPDHPLQDENFAKTEQRARDYAAAADEASAWLGCSSAELREMLEHEAQETK